MAASGDDLRAVLFDLDGTLIETHIDFPAMSRAMQEMARRACVPGQAVASRDILGIVEAAAEWLSARGEDGAAFRHSAFARLEEMEVSGCANPILLPGSDTLLGGLQERGIKTAIVTRNCRSVAAQLLARYRLPYDALLARDDVRRTKPHPEHLWDALRVLNQPAASSAMVGDHWMDMQAGRAAGCAMTIALRGRHDEARFAPCPPTHLVSTLGDVLNLLTG